MTKYMLLLAGADVDKRSGNASLAPEMFRRYSTWLKSLHESGRYVDSYKIHDQTGARLTVRGGEVVEGPFMETKEAVGGIFIIQASSLEEAVATARECPIFDVQKGHIEVRVIEDPPRPGRG